MHIHVLTFFFFFVDAPLTAIFDEGKGINSSQLHEQRDEENNLEREMQEHISLREDDKGQEEKEREKDGERLVQLLVSFLFFNFRLSKMNAFKQSVY